MPEASKADVAAVRRTPRRARARPRGVMPGSSDFRTSPTLLLSLMPLRSKGMWLPVTITPARPVERRERSTRASGSCRRSRPGSRSRQIACAQARMMRSVLGRRSPARTTVPPARMSPMPSRYRSAAFDVDVGLEIGDVLDQAAQSAGAKGQRDRRVIKKRGTYKRFRHWSLRSCKTGDGSF